MISLSIFNLNCWLFPIPLSSDCDFRLIKILDMIKERDPDIITLQEVWSNKYLKYLAQNLQGYFLISSKSPIYNQSGLVTFVKKQPLSSEINFFKLSFRQNFTEWILRKGYITVVIELGGKKFTIVNTHLYASFSKFAKIIPEKQLANLMNSIPNNNVILCGDLNLGENEIEQINQDKFVRLCNSEPTSDIKNIYCHKRFNKFMSNKSKKIDYFFFGKKLPEKFQYEIIKSPFVSDHYPMFTHINFLP